MEKNHLLPTFFGEKHFKDAFINFIKGKVRSDKLYKMLLFQYQTCTIANYCIFDHNIQIAERLLLDVGFGWKGNWRVRAIAWSVCISQCAVVYCDIPTTHIMDSTSSGKSNKITVYTFVASIASRLINMFLTFFPFAVYTSNRYYVCDTYAMKWRMYWIILWSNYTKVCFWRLKIKVHKINLKSQLGTQVIY